MELKQRFHAAIKSANNIVITTHLFPDADGIGSQIGLCLALRKIGKNVICCNEEPLLERYKYLDPQNVVIGLSELGNTFKTAPDLIIVVDTNTVFRTGHKFMNYVEQNQSKLLFIDHHPCPESIKKNNCIDTSAAATGQLVGELIESLGIDFDKDMSLPLYTAILIDTSSFRYPTVSSQTHRLISKLMATGVEPPEAYNRIYGTKKIEHMHLLGKVLSSANSNRGENIAWIVLKKEELEDYQIDIEDTHAFINHLLILDNINVACMFRDDGNQVKVSLRSTGDVDVGIIAIGLGGGGHSHSAATLITDTKDKDLQEIIGDTISKIEELLDKQLK